MVTKKNSTSACNGGVDGGRGGDGSNDDNVVENETKSMNGKSRRKKLGDVSPVREEEADTETDTDSILSKNKRFKRFSLSNLALRNVISFLS